MSDHPISISKNLIDYCINPCDLDRLDQLQLNECRQILPFLTRIWTRSSCFDEMQYSGYKIAILEKLRLYEDTNRIRSYLSADFSQIYEDVIRHLSTRYKFAQLSLITLKFCSIFFSEKRLKY